MDIFIYISVLTSALLCAVIVRVRILSFAGQKVQDYEGLGPVFDLPTHLDGALICDGVIFGPTGRVTSRFNARMIGTWEGDTGTLHEEFTYDSGAQQTRAWHLEVKGPNRFVARADDVIGIGVGRNAGPAVRLSYRIVLPQDSGGHKLDVIDWMYLDTGGNIINRSQFFKYGFKVAELIATIRKDTSE
ncbi:DUF3833 family protein [Maribius pontilimi]|uniref:DUF3833 family protein n=1 Tax=Palleronia pontilimi TaxID=1964209 RepID=A0A934MAX4_9RHOB|nr:DUF3833 family protein [Palleronia pontilimi]MBJ3764117.1 DUF3833 family protein [Palleronia pontilimi]